ncbi:MAG: CapA family protein [Alistipes sp.]|nr:CapA family protein [Alistipes sp.]
MKILIAGDFCPRQRIQKALDNEIYSFFDEIKPIVASADYSIVNLECPIVIDNSAKPIKKCGPNLKTSPRVIEALKYANFDCVTLANNHFADYGDVGCNVTLDLLNKAGIEHVGGGRNLEEAQRVLYKQLGNKVIGIVNVCENEFSIATEKQSGSAPLDAVDNYNQITEARTKADIVIVIVHGGHEHYQLPSPRMKKLYRHFITIGADAVVNHHQHCYSGYEYFNGKPIIYGLGNFCFDNENTTYSPWTEGYMVNIDTETLNFELIPYNQCDAKPIVSIMSEQDNSKFIANIERLNSIIADDRLTNTEFDKWVNQQARRKATVFAPYFHRYLNAAANRGLIPLRLNRKNAGIMLNHIACEAHRDITIRVLSDKLQE